MSKWLSVLLIMTFCLVCAYDAYAIFGCESTQAKEVAEAVEKGAKTVAPFLPPGIREVVLAGAGLIGWIRGRRYKVMLGGLVDSIASSFEQDMKPEMVAKFKQRLKDVLAQKGVLSQMDKFVKKQTG